MGLLGYEGWDGGKEENILHLPYDVVAVVLFLLVRGGFLVGAAELVLF